MWTVVVERQSGCCAAAAAADCRPPSLGCCIVLADVGFDRWHLQWMGREGRRKILFRDTIIRNSYTSMELTARNVGHQWVVASGRASD